MPKRKQDAVASSGSATVAALSISLPSGPSGLRSTTHGDVFQLKLLILFLIRTIAAGYQFQLGTEIPGMGGKFDDLIFKYQNKDATATKKDRYRIYKPNTNKKKPPKSRRPSYSTIAMAISVCVNTSSHTVTISSTTRKE